MRVLFHPQFPKDVRRFELEYAAISNGLAARFQSEVSQAVDAVKSSPTSAGHFLNISSKIVPELRRRNLLSFPFFVLCGAKIRLFSCSKVLPVLLAKCSESTPEQVRQVNLFGGCCRTSRA